MDSLSEKLDAIEHDTPLEDIANVIGICRDIERDIRSVRVRAEAFLQARLEAGPQRELVIGHLRWYVRRKRTVRPSSLEAVADAVLRTVEGDLSQFCDALSSDAFKPGHCRKLLGDDAFGEVFVTRDITKLERGEVEVAVRELAVIDTRFATPC